MWKAWSWEYLVLSPWVEEKDILELHVVMLSIQELRYWAPLSTTA